VKTCANCNKSKSVGNFKQDGRYRDNLAPVCWNCREGSSLGDDDMPRYFAVWSSAYIGGLPDTSFLYIEPGQDKDDEGKTTPRSARHFPVKDADGNVDLPHVRNALSRVEQWQKLSDGTEVSDALKTKVRTAAQKLLAAANKKLDELPDDANERTVDEAARALADELIRHLRGRVTGAFDDVPKLERVDLKGVPIMR